METWFVEDTWRSEYGSSWNTRQFTITVTLLTEHFTNLLNGQVQSIAAF